MTLVLRELTDADLPLVEGWFAEAETGRWLGDQSWPRRLLRLAARSPDRFAYAALRAGVVVALADAERYRDRRAGVALVVAPAHRRRGVGTAVARALAERPDLADVVEFIAGVEDGNVAGTALVVGAGFWQVTDAPDGGGFTYFAVRPDGGRPRRPWALPAD
jgi:L-amino acid N-acyltransferase YncA